ncbi:MAG: glycosyltransferase family 2 protein [Thermoleophilia bacterium]
MVNAIAAAVWSAVVGLQLHERRAVPEAAAFAPAEDDVLPVAVVVPARDEARSIGHCVATLRAQTPPVEEIVVVDDGSTDGTAEAARRAADGDARVRVVEAGPLPDGWIGKNWACWRGAREVPYAAWLVFSDADMVFEPDAVARALTAARTLGRGGVTLFPRVDCVSRAERWVIPAALVAIATFVAPGPLARHPSSPVALAAGGFILVERGLYDRIGGHRAQRSRMVDDVTLAARVKAAGGLLSHVQGHRVAHLRMYHGARDLWRGWRKNASFGHPGGPGKAIAGAALVAALTLAPWFSALAGARSGRRAPLAAPFIAIGAQVVAQRLAGPMVPTPRRDAVTLPVGMVVLVAAATRGALDRMTGGAVWRGRRYPSAT